MYIHLKITAYTPFSLGGEHLTAASLTQMCLDFLFFRMETAILAISVHMCSLSSLDLDFVQVDFVSARGALAPISGA